MQILSLNAISKYTPGTYGVCITAAATHTLSCRGTELESGKSMHFHTMQSKVCKKVVQVGKGSLLYAQTKANILQITVF